MNMKIYVNNIAGTDKHMRKLEVITNYMETNNLDVFLGQEMNITTRNTDFKRFTRRHKIREYHYATAESDAKFSSYKKPGGTFCITGPRFKHRITERIEDYMGRWAGCIYRTKGLTFALISVYQTVDNTHHGPTSIHSQQLATILKEGRNLTPRQAFYQDLTATIKLLQGRRIEVIISGDFNSEVTSQSMEHLLNINNNLELISNPDAIQSSYRLGKSCIDHALTTKTLADKVYSVSYLDYPQEFYTDHKPILITLQLNKTMGKPITHIKQRRLHSKDQQNARKYIEHKHRLCQHYKIEEKIKELEAKVKCDDPDNSTVSEQTFQEINNLDNMLTNISLESERCIQPRGQGKWCREAIQCQKACVQLRHQQQLSKRSGNYSEVSSIRKEVARQSKKLEGILKNQSNAWLKQLKDQLNELPNDKASKAKRSNLKTMIRHTHERRMFERIKETTGKIKFFESPAVAIPIGSITKIITDPDKIARHFRNHNVQHFAQAHGCLFSSTAFQDVTNKKEFSNMQLEQSTPECKIQEAINEISVNNNDDLEITQEEWRNKFKHWKESTSTSPSGVHLGHYKTLLSTIYVPNDTQLVMDMELFEKQNDIFNLHIRFINLVVRSGRSITRWRRCNNICIPKIPGCIDINKYRNIHIYECDLNAILAIKWRNAIQKAEDEMKLCESQFGSRKTKTSQLPILIEILQQDYARVARKSYGQINYDAKACYDRILPMLASVVSESFGVHQSIVRLHQDLLKHMEYHVTIPGSRKEWKYYDTMNNPVYGTGQGSGNSPHIWTMISSVLLQTLNNEANGAVYQMNNGIERRVSSTAYVDDVNTHHNSQSNQNVDMITSMIRDYNRWKEILEASGGKLAIDKCTYYALDWEFSRGGKPAMKDYKIPSTQTDFESSNIRRISINEFHKSLGHLISPKDPGRTQILQLRGISNKFQGILKNGSLSPREYEALYKSVYTPTIKYILQGSSMTQKELNEVSIPDKHLFLQKMRYSKNMARDIVTGSNELGGLGMLDFYAEQGILNIQILLKALADNQLVGDITRITIHKWKWHLGSGNDPFWKHKYQYPQDESQWLQNVRRFAVQNGIQICSGPNNFPLQRVHDTYIMEWAEEMGFTNFELRFLNHCRLYLNVISISDISNESGNKLEPAFTKFKLLPDLTPGSQVNQSKPDHTKWSIWFKFLANITRKRQNTLKQPLGEWIVDFDQIRKRFTTYRTLTNLYKYRQDEIQNWNIYHIAGTEWTSRSCKIVEEIPKEAVPCLQSYTGMIYTGYQRAGTNIQEIHLQKKHQVKAQEITGDPTKFIRKVIQADRMENYYERKFEESYKYIEWSVFKKAIKKKRAKGALLKMLHGVTPTKKHLTKIRLTIHSECPCCRQQDEDIFHVLTCNVRAHTAEEVFLQEIKKSYKDLNNKDSVWIQILDSARSTDNKMSNWSLQHQTTIGWDQLLKGFITKEWNEVMENLVPDRNWEDTMATTIVALWQTWLAMWKHRNNSIDYNTRFCTQFQDDNNKLSLQIIYTLRHFLGTSIQRVMKKNIQEHLKMHRDQVSDWLTMYLPIIKDIIDEEDPEIWMTTRETWILQNRQDESLVLNEGPVRVHSIHHEGD